SFCAMKETMNKAKRQPMEWGKIIANDIFGKGSVSKIYIKNLYNFTPKKQTILLKRDSEYMDWILSPLPLPLPSLKINKLKKERCSTSLIIREVRIKTTMRYHLIPVRMVKIKNRRKKCGPKYREMGAFLH
ncbi:LORF2 protein, partial [Crocuta crocuta]